MAIHMVAILLLDEKDEKAFEPHENYTKNA